MNLHNRLKRGLFLFLVVFLVGTVGFKTVGPEGTPWIRSGYAARDPGSDRFYFAPDPDTKIKEGMSLIVLGNADCLPNLRAMLG